jgi:chemotaxis protein methyltransferase CheR
MNIVATDIDGKVLNRACDGRYSRSSFWELPEKLLKKYFYKEGDLYRVKEGIKDGVNFIEQDIRKEMPIEEFHLVLCRNLVFTYFDEQLQRMILEELEKHIIPGGFLIIGCHEELPTGNFQLDRLDKYKMIHCKN